MILLKLCFLFFITILRGRNVHSAESRKSTGDSAGGDNIPIPKSQIPNFFVPDDSPACLKLYWMKKFIAVDSARMETKSQFRNPKSKILKCSSLSLRVFEAGIMVSFSDSLSAGGEQELNHAVDTARMETKSQFRNPKSQISKCSSLSLRVFEAGIMVSFSDSLEHARYYV